MLDHTIILGFDWNLISTQIQYKRECGRKRQEERRKKERKKKERKSLEIGKNEGAEGTTRGRRK